MERIQQWQYYISSYMRIEHTEGVARARLQKVLLERNLPSSSTHSAPLSSDSSAAAAAAESSYAQKPMTVHEGLVVRICLNSYKMVFEKGTCDFFMYDRVGAAGQEDKAAFERDLRAERFRERMVTNNAWMKGMSHEEVQKIKDEHKRWKDGEVLGPSGGAGAGEEKGDVAMLG
jgi:paired amphipathic helix protein Sin3a